MPQSLANILVHVIFSTKNRYPYLADDKLRKEVHSYIASLHRAQNCPALLVGGPKDHVHTLCKMARNTDVSSLVGEVKRKSSKWVKRDVGMLSKFGWQSGYGAFSIGQSQVRDVVKYIKNQDEHHRVVTFKEEFRKFLEKYEVDYDEQYLWD